MPAIFNFIGGLSLDHCGVFNNTSGAIFNRGSLSITDSSVSSNAVNGSASAIQNSADLTITHTDLIGNSTTGRGGAIRNDGLLAIKNGFFGGNSAPGGGGAIDNSGTITELSYTLLDGNVAPGGGSGGAIFNDGGTIFIIDSTLVNNFAGFRGGAIYNSDNANGFVGIAYSTVARNGQNSDGALYNGFVGGSAAGIAAAATIVANHDNCGGFRIDDFGFNIDSGFGCRFGFGSLGSTSVAGTDPLLDPHGVQGKTVAILPDSPARDAIPVGQISCGIVVDDNPAGVLDQRGFTRPAGGKCDIGAYEFGAVPRQ
jgi:hypothetical protein